MLDKNAEVFRTFIIVDSIKEIYIHTQKEREIIF